LIGLVPVEICLSFSSGTDDEIKTLRNGGDIGWSSQDRGLIKTIVSRLHPVMQFGLGSLEDVVAGGELTGDGLSGCLL
jgi:hypothetical protein